MRNRFIPPIALVLVALAGSVSTSIAQGGAAPGPSGSPSSTSAAETIRTLFAAAERGDLAALDTLYAGDSLTVVEGAGINRGWADYRDHHLAPELKEMKNFKYRPYDIVARTSGDLAWVMFSYGIQGEMGTRVLDQVGRGTAILERRGQRWVVRHTQTSSRARRPSDAPFPK
ncbi:MAG: nuclear transport factor 2 family protein [Gemmatimonadaceae bacterium]